MPTYHYYCPECGDERREFHYMADRHQSCSCGNHYSIGPQRLHVIHDIDWQDGRTGDGVDMSNPLGKREVVSSKRRHRDVLKEARENYYNDTGIDLGEYHVVEENKGKDTPMSAFDSSVPYVGKDNETMDEFERRVTK